MQSGSEVTRRLLDRAYRVTADNLTGVTLDEALFLPAGGYRSVLGTLKHMAGWSHVYHSFAFDASPTGWTDVAWPRGLRDTVDFSQTYLDEVIAWYARSHDAWMRSLNDLDDAQLEQPRPLHWGETARLFDIVTIMANHHVYHAGEINQLLSIARQEAWEETEEVEENHISTLGHRVKPSWME